VVLLLAAKSFVDVLLYVGRQSCTDCSVGVLLPLTLAPTWMRVIVHLNPPYYVVEASRSLASGSTFNSTVGVAFLVMVPLTTVTLWLATRVQRRMVA